MDNARVRPDANGSLQKSFAVASGAYTLAFNAVSGIGPYITLSLAEQPLGMALACPLAELNKHMILAPRAITSVSIDEDESEHCIIITGRLQNVDGVYEVMLRTYAPYPGLVRWTVDVHPNTPLSVTSSSQDVFFMDLDKKILTEAEIVPFAQQRTLGVGVCYLYDLSATESTLLYWQDFSSLMDYFSFAEQSPRDTVQIGTGSGLNSPWRVESSESGQRHGRIRSLGFLPPVPTLLPPGRRTRIRDTYLYMLPGLPDSRCACSKRFVLMMGRVYGLLHRPETEYTDWEAVARKTIVALKDPGNWIKKNGNSFICPYVHSGLQDDFPHAAHPYPHFEILLALKNLNRRIDIGKDILEKLIPNTAELTAAFDALDKADPWDYFHHHVDIARLARLGDACAKEYSLRRAPQLIALARDLHYDFKLAMNLKTHEIDFPNIPEYDIAGAYAYLMTICHDLTDDVSEKQTFIAEAQAALQALAEKSFEAFYSGELTPVGAIAAARLALLTGEPQWLEYAYIALGNVFLNAWLWESDYNYSRYYSTFFGVSTLRGQTILAGMEAHRTGHFIREFYNLAYDKLLPEANLLCAELIKYTLNVYRYAIPAFLPEDAYRHKPSLGTTIRDYYIPLESLQDGWEKSGQVGQEIYGAGGVFENLAKAFIHMPASGFRVYCEYPVDNYGFEGRVLSFRVLGPAQGSAKVEVVYEPQRCGWRSVQSLRVMRVLPADEEEEVPATYADGRIRFEAAGDSSYRVLSRRTPRKAAAPEHNRASRVFAQPDARVLYLNKANAANRLNVDICFENNGQMSCTCEPWASTCGYTCEVSPVTVAPGTLSVIPVQIEIPEAVDRERSHVLTVGANGQALRSYEVQFVDLEDGFVSDSNDFSGWTTEGDMGAGAISIHRGNIRISPRDGAYMGGVERKITVNLDTYRYFTIKIADCANCWGIFMKPEGQPPFYLQSENWKKQGVLSYDLRDMFRGRGIRRFSLFVYTSAWGQWEKDHYLDIESMKLTNKPWRHDDRLQTGSDKS